MVLTKEELQTMVVELEKALQDAKFRLEALNGCNENDPYEKITDLVYIGTLGNCEFNRCDISYNKETVSEG